MRLLPHLLLAVFLLPAHTRAQQSSGLKDLAVPVSPGFQLIDLSPTLVQAPAAPKELAVGVLQSLDGGGWAWPQNYSLETAPYWWAGVSRSAYDLLGQTANGKARPFAGLRFTSVSAGFLQKDMLADGLDESQKIFAAGVRTTALSVRSSAQRLRIDNLVREWMHEAEENSLEAITDEPDSAGLQEEAAAVAARDAAEGSAMRRLVDELAEKPVFTLDLAGAYSVYGIGDAVWRTGRYGAWATAALNLPLRSKRTSGAPARSHFSILALGRYLQDDFVPSSTGLQSSAVVDAGGRLVLQVQRFSLGVEGVWRSVAATGGADGNRRLVGTLVFRVKDNLYVNGTFGENFDNPDKLVSLFGIALGFGEERVDLPGGGADGR